jgi:hypothetical protein
LIKHSADVDFDAGVTGLRLKYQCDVRLASLTDDFRGFNERWNSLSSETPTKPATGIKLTDLSQRLFGDPAGTAGCPVDRIVMDDDQFTVGRSLNVNFDCDS